MDYNIEIVGRQFFQFKSIMKRYFKLDAIHFFQVKEFKDMYKVILKDDKSVRLDIYINDPKTIKEKIYYHEILNNYEVNIPKLIGFQKTPDQVFKASMWIDGPKISKFWSHPHIFQKAGEQIAKINMIKDPETDYYLTFDQFNKDNAIFSNNKKVYLIGNFIKIKEDINSSIVQMLLKNISDKDRIEAFLRGYSKIRNAYKIRNMIIEKNYKWKKN